MDIIFGCAAALGIVLGGTFGAAWIASWFEDRLDRRHWGRTWEDE